jgi:hypothetical protein
MGLPIMGLATLSQAEEAAIVEDLIGIGKARFPIPIDAPHRASLDLLSYPGSSRR